MTNPDEGSLVESNLTDLERQLLLGTGTWGSWMFSVGGDLVAKGLGRRDGRGSIYFDTPLAVQVRSIITNKEVPMTDKGSLELVEKVARALYEHWVSENLEDDWAGWERLGDKQTWLDRATAALDATPLVKLREALDDEAGLRELGLLYNCAISDDSPQFTRWQMIVAMNHGIRLAALSSNLEEG